MIKKNYFKELIKSKKPFIIYKSKKGFDLYTNFSEKIILTNKNVENFINKVTKKKPKKKETDLFIGFFGYEILCNLLKINIRNQKKSNFYKGIFYKPETIITISDKINVSTNLKKKQI